MKLTQSSARPAEVISLFYFTFKIFLDPPCVQPDCFRQRLPIHLGILDISISNKSLLVMVAVMINDTSVGCEFLEKGTLGILRWQQIDRHILHNDGTYLTPATKKCGRVPVKSSEFAAESARWNTQNAHVFYRGNNEKDKIKFSPFCALERKVSDGVNQTCMPLAIHQELRLFLIFGYQ